MRWLMIGLLVSLGALLLAAAGVARHIFLHRKELQREASAVAEIVTEKDLKAGP